MSSIKKNEKLTDMHETERYIASVNMSYEITAVSWSL